MVYFTLLYFISLFGQDNASSWTQEIMTYCKRIYTCGLSVNQPELAKANFHPLSSRHKTRKTKQHRKTNRYQNKVLGAAKCLVLILSLRWHCGWAVGGSVAWFIKTEGTLFWSDFDLMSQILIITDGFDWHLCWAQPVVIYADIRKEEQGEQCQEGNTFG